MTDVKAGADMVIEIEDLDAMRVLIENLPEGTVISVRVEEVMSHAAEERK